MKDNTVTIQAPAMRINAITVNGTVFMAISDVRNWLADLAESYDVANAHEYYGDAIRGVRNRLGAAIPIKATE